LEAASAGVLLSKSSPDMESQQVKSNVMIAFPPAQPMTVPISTHGFMPPFFSQVEEIGVFPANLGGFWDSVPLMRFVRLEFDYSWEIQLAGWQAPPAGAWRLTALKTGFIGFHYGIAFPRLAAHRLWLDGHVFLHFFREGGLVFADPFCYRLESHPFVKAFIYLSPFLAGPCAYVCFLSGIVVFPFKKEISQLPD